MIYKKLKFDYKQDAIVNSTFRFFGAYKPDVEYRRGDITSFNKKYYVYINDTPTSNNNPTNETFWEEYSTTIDKEIYSKKEVDDNFVSKVNLENNYYNKQELDMKQKQIINITNPIGSLLFTYNGEEHYLVKQNPTAFEEILDNELLYLAIGKTSGIEGTNSIKLQKNNLPNVDLSHYHDFTYNGTTTDVVNYQLGAQSQQGPVSMDGIRSSTSRITLNLNNQEQQPLEIKPKALKIRAWKVIGNIYS